MSAQIKLLKKEGSSDGSEGVEATDSSDEVESMNDRSDADVLREMT